MAREPSVLGELLRFYRTRSGLTQRALGEKVGFSTAAISRFEDGSRIPNRESLQRLADVLRIDKQLVNFLLVERLDETHEGWQMKLSEEMLDLRRDIKALSEQLQDLIDMFKIHDALS